MNPTLETIHSLRSIHGNFSDREIASEDLEAILAAAVRAANASARQSYSIVVLEDRERMKEVCHYVASKALVFCVDYNRLIDLADHLGYAFGNQSLGWLVTGSTDTILAAQTAAIAAKSLGIDSLFTNSLHRGDITRVYRLLNLPEKNCFPLVALLLGYPKEQPDHQKGRLAGPGIIHRGEYKRLTPRETEAMIAEYDDPDRHLALAWDDKSFKHYLDWFFSAWSQCPRKGVPPAKPLQERNAAPKLYDLLHRAGFLLSKQEGEQT